VPTILAGSSICERFLGDRAEAERVVEFSIGKKSSIGGSRPNREAGASIGGRNRA
jgi:hypothetical protein